MITGVILLGAILLCVALVELVAWLLGRRREYLGERDFLHRTARNYGVEPRPRETNESLRFRLRAHMQRPNPGSLQGMIACAGEVRGVERVFVVDEGPGRLSMYIEPNDPDVVARVREALRDEVVCGLDLNVQGAGADDAA